MTLRSSTLAQMVGHVLVWSSHHRSVAGQHANRHSGGLEQNVLLIDLETVLGSMM